MNRTHKLVNGRKAVASVIAAAAMAVAGSAYADPISFLPNNTDISIKFVDREIQITQFGQELFGIFNVTQINNADSSTTFWNGNGVTDGTQLVGFFSGLMAIPDQTGGTGLSFTGGQVTLYSVPNGSYSPGTNPNTLDPANQLCGGLCPTAWLTADFVPGINDAINGDATLQAAFATTNVQAGFGYLSVTGGTNADFFDSNGYTFANFDPADMFLRSNFTLANAQTCSNSNGWQVCSDDPIQGLTVPEPGSIALLGLGLVSLGAFRLRRKAA